MQAVRLRGNRRFPNAALALAVSLHLFGLPFLDVDAGSTAAEQVADTPTAARVHDGLIVLYAFVGGDKNLLHDLAGLGEPIDLLIDDETAVQRSEGQLKVRQAARLRSAEPAMRITKAVGSTGELTVEAWIQPADTKQDGPARIVSLSSNPSERNFTLGQEGNQFDFRLRTTKTSRNGIPSLSTPGLVKTKVTHVAYTHSAGGRSCIYVDGEKVAQRNIGGDMSNWDESMRLLLANEQTGDRPWRGTYHLVALYNRALAAEEIEQNFRAGSSSNEVRQSLAAARRQRSARQFETAVAPLLANHCLECHDGGTKKGGLDLSRRPAALAGGDSGRVLVPGQAEKSPLWERVADDQMPLDRPSLSNREKNLLRQWIEDGAVWTTDLIDPAIYAHDQRVTLPIVQRLTVPEYVETVRSCLNVDIAERARRILPPDVRADGFSNTAYNLGVDLGHVEAYAQLAEIIVERLDVPEFTAQFVGSRERSDKNLRSLIAKMGKWLLRGPLQDREVDVYHDISQSVVASGGDFDEASSAILLAMLQSPRFIYRMESQIGSGRRQPVDRYELASRLSYILWGGPPDRELMRAADENKLSSPEQMRSQVERMLKDPRAIERSEQFVQQWLHLDRLENLQPDRRRFPDWEPQLAEDMRRETLELFVELTWRQKRPMSDLLNADLTFATPRLARHYGLAVRGSDKDVLARYDLSQVPSRGGLLTHGSVLTIGGDHASMVSRGLFVLHDLLRGTVGDPPACVDTTPVPTREGLTQRAIAEARVANRACGSCHVKFEPLAFGLEKFDGLGRFRQRDEHGNRLREDGTILFPGSDEPRYYDSSAELMDLLAGSDRVRETFTWKIAQFALGRPLTGPDRPHLAKIHETAWQRGGTYQSLITAIVMSELVQKKRSDPVP